MEKKFREGDYVWVGLRSYGNWPGQIMDPGENKSPNKKLNQYFIHYVGDNSYGWAKEDCIKPYLEFREEFIAKNRKSGALEGADVIDKLLAEREDLSDNSTKEKPEVSPFKSPLIPKVNRKRKLSQIDPTIPKESPPNKKMKNPKMFEAIVKEEFKSSINKIKVGKIILANNETHEDFSSKLRTNEDSVKEKAEGKFQEGALIGLLTTKDDSIMENVVESMIPLNKESLEGVSNELASTEKDVMTNAEEIVILINKESDEDASNTLIIEDNFEKVNTEEDAEENIPVNKETHESVSNELGATKVNSEKHKTLYLQEDTEEKIQINEEICESASTDLIAAVNYPVKETAEGKTPINEEIHESAFNDLIVAENDPVKEEAMVEMIENEP